MRNCLLRFAGMSRSVLYELGTGGVRYALKACGLLRSKAGPVQSSSDAMWGACSVVNVMAPTTGLPGVTGSVMRALKDLGVVYAEGFTSPAGTMAVSQFAAFHVGSASSVALVA